MKISDKTIERLIIYKFLLERLRDSNCENVYSHQIASLAHLKASQVRRDFMIIGYSGNQKTGYNVKKLINSISEFLNPSEKINVILLGVGNLGRALLRYYSDIQRNYSVVACFDIDKNKIGEFIYCTKCYSLDDLKKIINEYNVKTAIVTVPAKAAQEVVDKLVSYGIKGIINFAPVRIKVPNDVYVEYIDFSVAVEKVNFFAKHS